MIAETPPLDPPVALADPIVLPYALPSPASARARVGKILWLSALAPAAMAPFVSFTYNTSPHVAVMELFNETGIIGSDLSIECCGASFFIAYAILAWRLRRLLWRPAGRMELRLALFAALVLCVPVGDLFVNMISEISGSMHDGSDHVDVLGIFAMAVMAICVVFGGVLALRARRHDAAASIEALLLAPYVANAAFCLIGFYEKPQIGYWLTAGSVAMLLPQWLLIPALARRHAHAE